MRFAILSSVALLTILALAVPAANAASLVGNLLDSEGLGLIDCRITLRCADSGSAHEAVSDRDGIFQFLYLPPGTYELIVTIDDESTEAGELCIGSGRGLRIFIEVIDDPSGGGPELRLHQDADFPLGSRGVSTINVDEVLHDLPLRREVVELARLAPGTVPGDTEFNQHTPGQDLVSMGGASVAENIFEVNGLNITNFRSGLGSTMVPVEFVEQLQVTIGGYEAEHGRSGGGVINMVTKSGSNTFHGGASAYFKPKSLQEQEPDVYFADNSNEEHETLEANATLSGPMWKDRLVFFGFVRYTDAYGTSITAHEAGAPGTGLIEESSTAEPYYGAKLDFRINPSHRIETTSISDEVGVEQSTYSWDRTAGTGRGDLIGEHTVSRGGPTYIANYTGIFSESFLLSAQYGKNEFDRTANSSADQNPVVYDHRSGSYIPAGSWVNWIYRLGFDEREAYRIDADAYFGSHLIHGGIDYEDNYSYESSRNSGDVYFLYDIAANQRAYVGDDLPDNQMIVRRRVYETGGDFRTKANALYVQDSWAITPALTANVGLRYEEFINQNVRGERFIDIDGR